MPQIHDDSGLEPVRPKHHRGKSGLVVSIRIYDAASPRDIRMTKDRALRALYQTVQAAGFHPAQDGDFFNHEHRVHEIQTPDGEVTPAHVMWFLAWKPNVAAQAALAAQLEPADRN